MKLRTVSVIEYFNDTIQMVVSFTDDKEGNAEAEELFQQCARDNDFSKDDVAVGLEEGYLDHDDGDYKVFLAHG